jgi:hypothetical protein
MKIYTRIYTMQKDNMLQLEGFGTITNQLKTKKYL